MHQELNRQTKIVRWEKIVPIDGCKKVFGQLHVSGALIIYTHQNRFATIYNKIREIRGRGKCEGEKKGEGTEGRSKETGVGERDVMPIHISQWLE